jgi:amino acid transporter
LLSPPNHLNIRTEYHEEAVRRIKMATTSATAKPDSGMAAGGLFLRKATGLVREVSALDLATMNTASMNLALGVATTFVWTPYLLNGGNILLCIILTTILMAAVAYVYATAVGAFPRSAADYVFVSRTLGPVWGFMFVGQWLLWSFFWMGFNAWAAGHIVLPGTLQALGDFTNNQAFYSLADTISSRGTVIVLALLLQVLFAALAIWGTKPYFTYLKITVGISVLSILAAFVVLLAQGGQFVERWNGFVQASGQGLAYDQVITTAIKAGFNPDQPFSLPQTLAMMPVAFWVVGYFTGSALITGEARQPRRSQFIGMLWAMVINGAAFAVLAIAVQSVMGTRFLSSLGFLYYEHPELLNLGSEPNFNFMIGILARSAPVIAFLGLGWVFWALNGTPNFLIKVPRALMALSFDRMAPEALGEVSDRYHTPVRATIVTAVMGAIAIVFLLIFGAATLPSSMMSKMFELIVVSVAGVVFPLRFRKLWESTTSARKIGGIPLMSIMAGVSVVVLAWVGYYFLFFGMWGANSLLSLSVVLFTILLGAAYYWAYGGQQKARGINIDLVYKEIPPE